MWDRGTPPTPPHLLQLLSQAITYRGCEKPLNKCTLASLPKQMANGAYLLLETNLNFERVPRNFSPHSRKYFTLYWQTITPTSLVKLQKRHLLSTNNSKLDNPYYFVKFVVNSVNTYDSWSNSNILSLNTTV